MVKDLCFEVIEKCLNNCKFCSSNSNCTKTKIIEFADFKRVIDYFMENGGIGELSLSGGEPFLHPDIVKMITYAKSLNIKTVIFTSGVIYGKELSEDLKKYYLEEKENKLNEIREKEPDNTYLLNKITRYYDQLLKPTSVSCLDKELLLKLKDIGLDKVVFDFQAYEDDTDSYLMGRKEISRVSLFDSLYNATVIGLDTDIHFIPMKPNYREIGDILELIEIVKVPNISILNFLPQGRGRVNKNNLELDEKEKKSFFEILEDNRKKYSGNIRIGIPLQDEDTHKCNAGLEKLDIKYDGTILPCPAFKELSIDECKRFNIDLPNIYDSLERVKITGYGTRVKPLCKQIYSERRE